MGLENAITALSKKIDSRVITIDAMHAANQERMARIESNIEHLDECIDSLNKKLFGNGQPGVIQFMEKRINDLEKSFWRITGAVAAFTAIINIVLIISKR